MMAAETSPPPSLDSYGNSTRTWSKSGCGREWRPQSIPSITPNPRGPAVIRRLWRAVLLSRRLIGCNTTIDRGIGPARRQPWRGHGSYGLGSVAGRAGLRAGQALPDRIGRLLGRPDQLCHRFGRSDRLHTHVRLGAEYPSVQHRVDRQSPDTIDRLGGADQSVVEMVRLFIVRNDHRHPEHQLPRRRRGGAPMDGNVDRARLRLAHSVLFRGRGQRYLFDLEFPFPARIAR